MTNPVSSKAQKKKLQRLRRKVKKEHNKEVGNGERLNRGQKPKSR